MEATVPDYQIPFITIIEKGEQPYAMFQDYPKKFFWIFSPLAYRSKEDLLSGFKEIFIDRAFEMQKQLAKPKEVQQDPKTVEDFLLEKNKPK